MFQTILLPLDGSRQAEGILPHAIALAAAFGAAVELLHVIPASAGPRRAGPADPIGSRMKRADGAGYLSEKASELRAAGVEVAATRVEEGGAAEVIVALLRDGGYDAVGLTPHGDGQWRYLSIGCTAVAVVLNAQTSILLAPDSPTHRGDASEPTSPYPYRRIMAPVDCSPRSDWAVGIAATLARKSGAHLQVVHILLPPEVVSRHPTGGSARSLVERMVETNRAEARRYLDETVQRHQTPDLSLEGVVIHGHSGPAEAVGVFSEEEDIDLVILSAHGRGVSSEWPLGGTAAKLMLRAQKPVLLLQDLPHQRRLREAAPASARALASDLRTSR